MRECWNRQTGRLEVPVSYLRRVGSSPISRTNKEHTFVYQKCVLCLSKPQAWYIIRRQAVYRQRRLAAFVSHHAVGVYKNFLRLDDIQPLRADDMQHFVLMRYKASPCQSETA